MIKSLSLLTRKPGMTHEQFVKHWLEVHWSARPPRCPATAVRAVAHPLESARGRTSPRGRRDHGVAELWYDDRESMLRALANPRGESPLRRRGACHRADQELHDRRKGDRPERS